jgi:hypothetical protein
MSRLKSSVLWLMLVLVLQTMGPTLACLVPARGSAQPACCREMAKDCGSSMGSDQSCCRVEQSQNSTEPGAVFSLENGHELNYTPVMIAPQRDTAAAVWQAVLSAPPPDISPGQSSVLRI